MRVIDQNGCDYPYESIAITHRDGIIYARPISDMERRYLIARYSTPEKAEKVMQKLHECYSGLFLIQNVNLSEEEMERLENMTTGCICINNRENSVRIEPLRTVFCFPQDDEL